MTCDHAERTIRVKRLGADNRPSHVGWQCDECYQNVRVGSGIWLPREDWPYDVIPGWRNPFNGDVDESLTFDARRLRPIHSAGILGHETQHMYVKFAAQDGDWRSLKRRGFEPTETMKRLFISMRASYLEWKKRRDLEEAIEAAQPKFWFELDPGHWVFAKTEEDARAWVESMKPVEIKEAEERERRFIDIDTSRTCENCKLRRKEPGRLLCGTCISLGYER